MIGRDFENHFGDDPIAGILEVAGFTGLAKSSSLSEVEKALDNLRALLCDADPMRRALVREAALRKLQSISIKSPARIIDATLKQPEPEVEQSKLPFLEDPEPWDDEVDSRELLEDLHEIIGRFVIMGEELKHGVVLWIGHSYALDAFDISPTLALTSPIKRSGKTTALELISLLAPRALSASSITAPVVYRAVEKYHPTLLVDEADTFLKDNEALQGILNSSHRKRSAFALRSHGEEHEPKPFSTWCAKAIALIGKLPGTMEDRAIVIHLKRKAKGDDIARFRPDRILGECETIRRKLARWRDDNLEALKGSDPEIPEALHDRAADNWRPLLTVADLAGGNWPRLARDAAKVLSGAIDEADESALIQLLADLHQLFGDKDSLTSAGICEQLGEMEDRPWPEWRNGKPISTRQLANLLRPLGIRPRTIRTPAGTPKGYVRNEFDDPFTRYLGVSSATTPQVNKDGSVDKFFYPQQNLDVANRKTPSNPHGYSGVADVADGNGKNSVLEGDSIQKDLNWEPIR